MAGCKIRFRTALAERALRSGILSSNHFVGELHLRCMEFRQLGRSGLKVPVLSFGTGTFGGGTEFFKAWGASDVAEATRLVDICLEAGVNLFDTADVYSDGLSETILGKAVAGRRDKVLISTKATFRMGRGRTIWDRRASLVQACEASLRRLGTDYIDIYHLHGFDALTPPEEVLSTLDNLVTSGKVRYIACSNFSGWHLMKSLARLRSLWMGAIRRPSGLLLADQPGVRMGTDAAGPRSGSGRAGLESTGMGTAHGKDPPRAAAAEREPPA